MVLSQAMPCACRSSNRARSSTYIPALQTGRPLRTMSNRVAEKTARELENYQDQDAKHLAELRLILDSETSDYAQ